MSPPARAPTTERRPAARANGAMGGRVALMFVAVAVLWGVPYALIRVALEHGAGPLLVAWTRVAIGAVVLLAIARARGLLHGLRAHLGLLVAIAVCDVAAPFTLLSVAEQHISSSLAGILVASTPLFVGLLAPALAPAERPGRRGWAGLLLGFAGVVALLGVELAGELAAAVAVLAAALGYAVATHLVARVRDLSPLAISAAGLSIAAILLSPGAVADLPTSATAEAWLALAALGVLCTGAAFALYYALVTVAGARQAALTTYLAPVVSVATGAAFLDEGIAVSAGVGLALILVGSWLAR